MLIKIFFVPLIILGTWYLGKNISLSYRQKADLIEEYILFLKSFKSAVCFSGTNMYSFFEKYSSSQLKPMLNFLISKNNIQKITEFNTDNLQEKACIKIISDTLILAQETSDIKLISDFFDEAIKKLSSYKKEYLEEYNGKIKTAPKLGLIVGLFVAVIIL